VRRVSRGKRITGANLRLDRYAGGAATKFAADPAAVQNHVYVEGKAHSIVVIPLKSVYPDELKVRIKSRKALVKASEESADPIPLAVFHADVPLEKVYVRAPRDPNQRRERDGGQREAPPETVKGTCPPDTYVLAVWWGRLCLAQPSLEFVCFLTKDEAKTGEIDLGSIEPEDVEAAKIEIDPDVDVVFAGFQVPLGGKDADEKAVVVVKTVTLSTGKNALSEAGTWRVTR